MADLRASAWSLNQFRIRIQQVGVQWEIGINLCKTMLSVIWADIACTEQIVSTCVTVCYNILGQFNG